MTDNTQEERLHKVLAQAGIASRRKCEDLIREGRVSVDGRIVSEMGVKVDAATQDVRVDGERIRPQQPVHLLVYKPRRYLCTTADQFGRKTVFDLVPEHRHRRLFSVGRLDQDAEGLVILTNDGTFANRLLERKRGLARTYFLKLRGTVSQETIAKAREGVWLVDGRTAPMEVQLIRAGREVTTLKCTLVERQHHQLRRLWSKLECPVQRMVLIRIGDVGTEKLKKAHARPLTPDEVKQLMDGPPGFIRTPIERKAAPKPSARASDWGRKAKADRADRGSGPPDRRGRAPLRSSRDVPKPIGRDFDGVPRKSGPRKPAAQRGGRTAGPGRDAGRGVGRGPSRRPEGGPSRGPSRGPSSSAPTRGRRER